MISERRREQLREADRRRNGRDREARNAKSRAYSKEHYSREVQRRKSAERRSDGSAAFIDWLRAERRRELRRGMRFVVEAEQARSCYEDWFDSLDDVECGVPG
jgi:hypothetical protein